MFSGGTVEAIQASTPDALAVAFSVLTTLGDPWLAIPILTITYWYGERRRALPLLATVFAGMALVLFAKGLLAFPRPDVGGPVPAEAVPELIRPLYDYNVEATGYGLPSGHAAIGAMLWGAVALSWPGTPSPRRIGAAAVVAVVVAISRVVIGVHYPADVIAGLLLGTAVLLVGVLALDRIERPVVPLFAAGIVVAVLAVGTSGAGTETLSLLGGLVGGLAGVLLLDPSNLSFTRTPVGLLAGVGGLVTIVALAVGTAVLAGIVTDPVPAGGILADIVPTVTLGVGIPAWPLAVERVAADAATSTDDGRNSKRTGGGSDAPSITTDE